MKHITKLDDLGSLRSMAVQDLKEKGVKVPKLRKRRCPSSQSGQTQDKGDRYVFGNNLFSMPGVFIEDCGFVPKFLVDAFTVVKNHIDTVGIFRKTGSVARQKELKHNLDNGGDLEVESSNVFDVTSLIKQFFRELPDSLLTTRLHDVFIKCHQLQESDSRLKHIQLMCLLLPLENLSTLKFTMQCCAEIASHSENNKMNVSNLAVVLTPNLIHTNSKSEKMTQVEGQLLAAQTSIIELLIEHSADIGMVDESLQERSHMMSTCFASEDELDRSCDESEEPKSKKKKRRSGSLQGIVSGISNTISKWSKRGGIKGASSNQSLVSSSSADMEDSSVDVGDAAGISIGIIDATPIVVRKRKASDEGVPFSATKRKAILQQMSNFNKTPFTPASTTKPRLPVNRNVVLGTPSINFTESSNSPISFTATPKKKHTRLFSSPGSLSRKKRASGGSPKDGKKKKGFFRRMSGGKSSPEAANCSDIAIGSKLAGTDPDDILSSSITQHNSSIQSTTSSKDENGKLKRRPSWFRRHKKHPSSPARILGNSAAIKKSSLSSLSGGKKEEKEDSDDGGFLKKNNEVMVIRNQNADIDVDQLAENLRQDLQSQTPAKANMPEIERGRLASREVSTLGVDVGKPRAHRRAYSADAKGGLKRGRPNTITSGLPNATTVVCRKPSIKNVIPQRPADISLSQKPNFIKNDLNSKNSNLSRKPSINKADIGLPIPVKVPKVAETKRRHTVTVDVDIHQTFGHLIKPASDFFQKGSEVSEVRKCPAPASHEGVIGTEVPKTERPTITPRSSVVSKVPAIEQSTHLTNEPGNMQVSAVMRMEHSSHIQQMMQPPRQQGDTGLCVKENSCNPQHPPVKSHEPLNSRQNSHDLKMLELHTNKGHVRTESEKTKHIPAAGGHLNILTKDQQPSVSPLPQSSRTHLAGQNATVDSSLNETDGDQPSHWYLADESTIINVMDTAMMDSIRSSGSSSSLTSQQGAASVSNVGPDPAQGTQNAMEVDENAEQMDTEEVCDTTLQSESANNTVIECGEKPVSKEETIEEQHNTMATVMNSDHSDYSTDGTFEKDQEKRSENADEKHEKENIKDENQTEIVENKVDEENVDDIKEKEDQVDENMQSQPASEDTAKNHEKDKNQAQGKHDIKTSSSISPTTENNCKKSDSHHKTNAEPKLQISLDTHKLLERAGFMAHDTKNVPEDTQKTDSADKCIVHESVINLQQAGKVTANVQLFSKASNDPDEVEIIKRHTSPLRFPRSQMRNRASPVRIPTIFAKQDRESARYRQMAGNVLRASPVKSAPRGVPNLPISTNLIRNRSVERSLAKFTARSVDTSSNTRVIPGSSTSAGPSKAASDSVEKPLPQSAGLLKCPPAVTAINIPQDLQETIDAVCTPKSQRRSTTSTDAMTQRSPLKTINGPTDHKEEKIPPKTVPHTPKIKSSLLSEDVAHRLLMRTPGSMTPRNTITPRMRAVVGSSQKCRSPVKPVKRLQGSPKSPHSPRHARSPKRYPSSPLRPRIVAKKSDLSPIPAYLKDDVF